MDDNAKLDLLDDLVGDFAPRLNLSHHQIYLSKGQNAAMQAVFFWRGGAASPQLLRAGVKKQIA
jgi:hypothetical protein